MLKIAISGKAKSGKDTLSKIIADTFSKNNHNFLYKTLAFADPIKQIVLQMYPFLDRNHLFGPSELRETVIPGSFKNGCPLTIRSVLQDIGEDFKKYNPKIWIEALGCELQRCASYKYDMAIVTDVRFVDEMTFLKTNGFYLIRLLRNDINQMSHISETQQNTIDDSEFDLIIHNNGSLDNLKEQAVKIQIK